MKQWKKDYWKLVRRCLVRFWGYSEQSARDAVQPMKKLIGGDDLTYHAEAYDVACDIAGKESQLFPHHSQTYFAMADSLRG
jgi:hypothetical protein